jgi:hypothetical protein
MSLPRFAAHTPPPNDPNNPDRWYELKKHLTAVAKRAEEFASRLRADQLGYRSDCPSGRSRIGTVVSTLLVLSLL